VSVNDIGPLFFQPAGQAPHVAQCRQPLAANGPFKKLAPGFPDLVSQRTIAADHGHAVTLLDQAGADFGGDPF